MLRLAIVFFVIAVILAFVGFGGFVSGMLLNAARWLFAGFLILAVVSIVCGRGIQDIDPL